MPDTLSLTPSESLTVVVDSLEALEVEATYGPHGSPPPAHLHPSQSEQFEVLAGSLNTRVDGHKRTLEAGDTLDIPPGTAHQMWNAGGESARVRWRTTPAGRTLEWFRALDALQREGRVGRNGTPGPLALAVLLTEYRDVFRPVGPPEPLLRAVFAVLAPIGRLRGYGSTARRADSR